MNRLALGTVQFGLRYGVANTSGQVAPTAIAAILRRAREAGIDTLDTAIAYGESEARLGDAGVASWRLVTKLPPLPQEMADVGTWVESEVQGSLQRLKTTRLDALMLHKAADLLGPYSKACIRALEDMKARGWVRSIGVSIYAPEDIAAVWPMWRPDIVQAPCNVFDRRLIQSGWLGRLSEAGVRVHIRSAFLQGLLLMPRATQPKWFDPWRGLLDRWAASCVQLETTPLAAALAFVLAQPGVERLVVGVDSLAQLDEILVAARARAVLPADDLYSEDRDLIDPSRWKLT
jgi:aryl-alcohol dehydrogenase-like predicted oxidoreductase